MIKVRCPICDRPMEGQSPAEWPQFPFCSPRCKLVDLGRWLGGNYRIAPDADGEAPASPTDEDPP